MAENENQIMGTKLIGLMSRAELIEELLMHQREQFQEEDDSNLKIMVINCRLGDFKNRMMAEAGLVKKGNFLGADIVVEEGEE